MVAVDLQTSSKPEGAYFVCHFHFLKSLARARSGLSDWLLQLQVWSSVTVHAAMTEMSLTDAAKGVKLSLGAHARAHACVVAPLQVRDVHAGTNGFYKRHRTGRVRHANCLISVIFMAPLTYLNAWSASHLVSLSRFWTEQQDAAKLLLLVVMIS